MPESKGSSSSAWFALEKILDGMLYRGFRILDWVIVFIYCFAPLWLLRKYRAFRGRGETLPIAQESLVGLSVKD